MEQVVAGDVLETSRAGSAPDLALPSLLVVVALAAAVAAQGAFYRTAQVAVGAVLLASVLAMVARRPIILVRSAWLRASVLGLGFWSILSAAVAGDVRRSAGLVCLLAGMAAVVAVVAARPAPERAQLCQVAAGLGALAALSGWVGVAWHLSPLALVDQSLWRAAGTITYANALAGLLAPLALLVLALLISRPTLYLATTACLLLTGLGASMSRGGLLAFVAGFAVLACLVDWRRLVSAATPPSLGAALALAGLAPSVSAGGPARPLLAVGGLLVGLAVALLVRPAIIRPQWALLLVTALGVVGMGALRTAGRLTLASADRVGEAEAALRLVGDHPLLGVGPGWKNYVLLDADGRQRVAEYVHNEYLEILAELGVVGLALLLALLAALGRAVWRSRLHEPAPSIWAGVVAGLVSAAVSAAFDFGWHVPALPLISALLIGVVVCPSQKERT